MLIQVACMPCQAGRRTTEAHNQQRIGPACATIYPSQARFHFDVARSQGGPVTRSCYMSVSLGPGPLPSRVSCHLFKATGDAKRCDRRVRTLNQDRRIRTRSADNFAATSARVSTADLWSPCKYGARTELQPGELRHIHISNCARGNSSLTSLCHTLSPPQQKIQRAPAQKPFSGVLRYPSCCFLRCGEVSTVLHGVV